MPKVQQSKVRAAKWCGNTTKIVLVGEDNNIYLLNSPVDQSSDVRLTNSGQAGLIYNGVPDWLYQGQYSKFILIYTKSRIASAIIQKFNFVDILLRQLFEQKIQEFSAFITV